MEPALPEDEPKGSNSTRYLSTVGVHRHPMLSRLKTDPSINGFPKSWQRYLREPLDYPVYLIRARDLYPLVHQQKAFDNWVINHPFDVAPGCGYNLLAMEGNVEDNCHPPHQLSLLIAAAIRGFPTARLTSKEIRLALMRRYSFFTTQGSQWHSDVTLTLNAKPHMFQSLTQTRPSRPKKGGMEIWWEMNPEYDPLNDNALQSVAKIPLIQPIESPVRLPKAMEIDSKLQVRPLIKPRRGRTNKSSNEPDSKPLVRPCGDVIGLSRLENLMNRMSLKTRKARTPNPHRADVIRAALEEEMKQLRRIFAKCAMD